MMNAVRCKATKFTLAKPFLSLIVAGLLLGGCSLSAEPPPIAQQSADLLDADSDGVINARDLCADTPMGAVINNEGCPLEEELTARDDLHILFANNSAVIPSSFKGEVNDLARFMKTFPDTSVELDGYASPVGNADYNLQLSRQRAEAVKRALVAQGVAADRIKIVGLGERAPVQASSPAESDVLSRRVTASVDVSKTDTVMKWTIYTSSADK